MERIGHNGLQNVSFIERYGDIIKNVYALRLDRSYLNDIVNNIFVDDIEDRILDGQELNNVKTLIVNDIETSVVSAIIITGLNEDYSIITELVKCRLLTMLERRALISVIKSDMEESDFIDEVITSLMDKVKDDFYKLIDDFSEVDDVLSLEAHEYMSTDYAVYKIDSNNTIYILKV